MKNRKSPHLNLEKFKNKVLAPFFFAIFFSVLFIYNNCSVQYEPHPSLSSSLEQSSFEDNNFDCEENNFRDECENDVYKQKRKFMELRILTQNPYKYVLQHEAPNPISPENIFYRVPDCVLTEEDECISFNVSGECNDGGFKGNEITWKAFENSKNEESLFFIPERSMNSCTNGRFFILIEIPFEKIAEVLLSERLYSFDIIIELKAFEGNSLVFRNSLKAKKTLSINIARKLITEDE